MSLRSEPIPDVPEETARVADAAFPKGNLYLKMRDELGTFYEDADFTDLFPIRGQPAFSPWRLALITVMQFAEGLSDRQAAEAVRSRIDWKYALSLELENAGFDFSILSEFRQRLLTKGKEIQLLDKMLECFQAKKLLKSGGKQRTDSTHILAKVRHLSRIESVVETLRAALNELAEFFPEWLERQITPRWFELYSRRIEEYRLPKGEKSRQEYIDEIGNHGFTLLKAIAGSESERLKSLPMVKLLEQMWEQQLEIKEGKVCFLAAEKLAPVGERFDSPYDAEAKFGKKRSTSWQGYKVHLTETCDQESPHLITNVITTEAFLPDTEVNFKIHEDLKEKGLSPDIHLVDAGYPENEWMLKSQKEGIRVVGPARPNHHWQAKEGKGFALKDFIIDWKNKQVVCPNGKIGKNWSTAKSEGKEKYRVRFKSSDCLNCDKRLNCTKSKRWRVISFAGKEEQEFLEKARSSEQSSEWQNLYRERAGIEGTISQSVRGYGLRQTRYIGKAKTHLHNIAVASAVNIVRGIAWLDGNLLERTRVSRFAGLAAMNH
jgi:transposase